MRQLAAILAACLLLYSCVPRPSDAARAAVLHYVNNETQFSFLVLTGEKSIRFSEPSRR